MASVHTESNADKVNVQNDQNVGEDERVLYVTLRGRPVNTSKTGKWKAAPFVYGLTTATATTALVASTLVPFLITYFHQPVSTSANATTNFTGTEGIVSIFGAFIADSYLGSFWTAVIGAILSGLGLGLFTLIAANPGLHLKPCTSYTQCPPAKGRYMAPLYVALYVIAIGAGLIHPNLLSFGGDQFDESNPAGKKQGIHFFAWLFFFTRFGLAVAIYGGVYLVTDVNHGWGYGFALMFLTAGSLVFLAGIPKYRHRRPAGSFLTRSAQVLMAALRKRNASCVPAPDRYDSVPPQSTFPKLAHTNQLRFLDRAAIINEEEKEMIRRNKTPDPWRLCSVRQVEECKRILQFVPVWISISAIYIVYAQLSTFTIAQAQTLDRKLGPHFTIPASSVGGIVMICSVILVPVYTRIFVPVARKFTKNPYGFSPLQRLGSSIVFAALTMMTAALVERRRLVTVRELHLEGMPLGSFVLPLKFWWLVPIYVMASLVELTFWVSSFEFFYHESSATTRSIGSSFTYSASGMGSFLSTVLVEIVNSVTRHHPGGGWLEEQLNNGGLEKFYWLLAVLLSLNFVAFLIVAYFYKYKHDWYHIQPDVVQPEVPPGSKD